MHKIEQQNLRLEEEARRQKLEEQDRRAAEEARRQQQEQTERAAKAAKKEADHLREDIARKEREIKEAESILVSGT